MSKTLISILFFFTVLGLTGVTAQQCPPADHDTWLRESFKQISSIQPGMTRQDALRVFTAPFGFFGTNRLRRTYAFKGSQHIRIDVEFTPASGTDPNGPDDPGDVIKAISRPYIAEVTMD